MVLHLITYLIPATFTTRLPDGGIYFWHKQHGVKMKVLMVYENVPESTEIYIFDANEDEVNDLKLSHGNYTNAKEGANKFLI